MHRLTREVRFSLVHDTAEQLRHPVLSGFAGHPAGGLEMAPFLSLRVTLAGALDPSSNYVRNIVEIDSVVRQRAVPLAAAAAARRTHPASLLRELFAGLSGAFPGSSLDELTLVLTPYVNYSCLEHPMGPLVRLSQKFEFSASHRLHNPTLSADDNRRCFGKCNNPHGHGHNYELEVSVRCPADVAATPAAPVDLPALQRIVNDTVIDRFDHRHLNTEVPPFDTVIPSVENIARVIYGLLKPALAAERINLSSVTVWETSKTWCRYSEDAADAR